MKRVPGAGHENFWRGADDLGIPGVIYAEGSHLGDDPYLEVG